MLLKYISQFKHKAKVLDLYKRAVNAKLTKLPVCGLLSSRWPT